MNIEPIAFIHTDFSEKFGIPRQSGLVESLKGTISFLPEYRNPDALKGLSAYSHIWLLWGCSRVAPDKSFHATVRPPGLDGNKRLGVFATRSPFRPNPIGLSCVKLLNIEPYGQGGPILEVGGVDIADGTPIYDIKPYLPYTDCRDGSYGALPDSEPFPELKVLFPEELANILPLDKELALKALLSIDPRPATKRNDEERIFGFPFAGYEVRFQAGKGVLRVISIEKMGER